MKIFAAGLASETNTFSPLVTSSDDFVIQRGRDVLEGRIDHPSLNLFMPWGQQAQARGDSFVFSLMAWAQPSGITTRVAYESLRDEILSDLQGAMPVDIALLMLHGAMIAEGYEDCEEDIIRRVRAIVGSEAVVAVELDLHCHLSESKIAAADIVLTYHEYPHVDINERAAKLFDLAVGTRLREIRPTMALFDCRMIGLYPTSRQPLRAFVDSMIAAEHHRDVLAVSFGHGFQFADVPNVGAKVLVATDDDPECATELARAFGLAAYGMRREIGFDSFSLPLDVALSKAVASRKFPVVVADQSDNTGGGAPGDSTYALRWLVDQQIRDAAIAIVYDPEVVSIARHAGRGAAVKVRLGGKLGAFSGSPVELEGIVLAVRERYEHALPQKAGEPWRFPAGDVVALSCAGIDIVVSSERCQCFSPSIFTDLDIEVTGKRLLVVKSAQHFYGAFEPVAAEIIYMAARGAVAPDPRLIPYRRLDTRCMYPWSEAPLRS
jgi:microcystin degradation protein MlrC